MIQKNLSKLLLREECHRNIRNKQVKRAYKLINSCEKINNTKLV